MKGLTQTAVYFTLVGLSTALFFGGCGGGSSSYVSETGGGETTTIVGTAYYLDAAVEGLNYRCGAMEGTTDANGSFQFEVGKECTFYVGEMPIRTVPADRLYDGKILVETDLNIASMLQMLDSDGNATNGITISSTLVSKMEELNITKKPLVYSDLLDMVNQMGIDMPDPATVEAHVAETLKEALREKLANRTFYAVMTTTRARIQEMRVDFDANLTTMTVRYFIDGNLSDDAIPIAIKEIDNGVLQLSDNPIADYLPFQLDTADYIEMGYDNSVGSGIPLMLRLYRDESKMTAFAEALSEGTFLPITRDDLIGKTLVVNLPNILGNDYTRLAVTFEADGSYHFDWYVYFGTTWVSDYTIRTYGITTAGSWTVVDGRVIGTDGIGTMVMTWLDQSTVRIQYGSISVYYPIEDIVDEQPESAVLLGGLPTTETLVFEKYPITREAIAGQKISLLNTAIDANMTFDVNGSLTIESSEGDIIGSWTVIDDYLFLNGTEEDGTPFFDLMVFDGSLERCVLFGREALTSTTEVVSTESLSTTTPDLHTDTLTTADVGGWHYRIGDDVTTDIYFFKDGTYYESGASSSRLGNWARFGDMVLMMVPGDNVLVGFRNSWSEAVYFDRESAGVLPVESREPNTEDFTLYD